MDEDNRSMTDAEIFSGWFLLKSIEVVELNVKQSIAPVFFILLVPFEVY